MRRHLLMTVLGAAALAIACTGTKPSVTVACCGDNDFVNLLQQEGVKVKTCPGIAHALQSAPQEAE